MTGLLSNRRYRAVAYAVTCLALAGILFWAYRRFVLLHPDPTITWVRHGTTYELLNPKMLGAILVAPWFVGVLVVVRPGFHQLGLGHLAAVGCALFAASANVILRVISKDEKQVSIIAINGVYQIVVAGALMLGDFAMPTLYDLVRFAVIGVLSGGAQLLIIRGMRQAPVSHIGPTQYVQIIWAVILGALFYRESQDAIGYGGLVLLIIAGIATIFSDGAQARISGRWAEFRARRGEPETNRVEGPEI